MNYRLFIPLLLLTASIARGEVKVLVERNQNEAATAEFRFKGVPALSDVDAGQDAAMEVIDGQPEWGCDPKRLIDGVGSGDAGDLSRSFFFGKGTNSGRIRMDLGAVKAIAQVNTYSWNNGNRAPQVYVLYGSDGLAPGFLASPMRSSDPVATGWTKIVSVDTRPRGFMKQDGGGGQYGVSISDTQGVIGRYRYLLWDIESPHSADWAATPYAEFDVVTADAGPPTRLAKIATRAGEALEGPAHLEGDEVVIRTGGAERKIKLGEIATAAFHEAPVVDAPAEEPSAGGLKAEYFDDQDLQKPRLVRYDPMVNFSWGLGAPDPSVNVDFSARWTGRVEPKYSEVYTFQTQAEDGARLWVDGKQIIDQWTDNPPFLQEGKIALQGGRKYDIRIEYHNKMGEAVMRLRWSSASQLKQVVPAARLSPPVNDPASPPRVTLVAPGAERWKIAPGSMDLEATATAPAGKIARVEFFSGNTLLGTVTGEPYKYTWAHVPPGHHKLTARATDTGGTITASLPVMVNVGANGSGSLPAPWGSMRLGAMERRDSSSYSGGLFTIRAGGGELRGAFDSGYFIAQPLDGDGQITVRVGDISGDATPNAVAGVMLRESLSPDARYAALLAGKDGTEYLCRREPASWVAANDLNRSVPCYLRIVRIGKYFKAYISENGSSWQLVGSDQLSLGSQAFVGLISTSRADDDLCTATMDHVQVIAGAPPMDATAPGVRTRGGGFFAGEIGKAEESQLTLHRARGKNLTLPAADIGRIYLRPVPLELSANIGRGRTGVLLANGDFYEGEFRGIKDGRVMVDSILFGSRSFDNQELLVVVLHDLLDEQKHPEVRMSDGSVYALKEAKLAGGRLCVRDEWAGEFSVSIRDVVEIQQ